jgi:hypothetical protein
MLPLFSKQPVAPFKEHTARYELGSKVEGLDEYIHRKAKIKNVYAGMNKNNVDKKFDTFKIKSSVIPSIWIGVLACMSNLRQTRYGEHCGLAFTF